MAIAEEENPLINLKAVEAESKYQQYEVGKVKVTKQTQTCTTETKNEYVFDENEEMVMVTLPNLIETRNTLNHLAKMIEINNRKLFIGCGNANNKVLKHKRDFLLEQVLTMTCMLYPKLDNMKINLKLGLLSAAA